MRILVVTPPYHQKSTGAAEHDIIATVRLLKQLGHTVSVAVLHPSYYDSARALELLGGDISVFTYASKENGFASWLAASLRTPALLDRAAYSFALMVNDAGFQAFFKDSNPDVVMSWCSYSWPALAYARERKVATVFRSHNFEPSFFYEALSSIQKWSPANWIRRIAKSLGERKAARLGDSIATIPFAESDLYRKWRNPSDVFTLTLTFLGNRLKTPFVHRGKKPLDVFYLGANYNVAFHLRGVEMIINEIAPAVLRKAPGHYRFHICGSKLPEALVAKCDGTDLIYEGYVEDFDAFMERMDIGAFPVRTGKSMKGKVFETISRAFPVVIAPNCLGGYDITNGVEALIADTSSEFVSSILSLQDDTLRQKLSEGAAAFAAREFGTESVLEIITKSLERARANHAAHHS